jgi:polyisoprenoid-binding protein YceI
MRAAMLAFALIFVAADSATTRTIDVAKSKVLFSVSHVFVEHVTGTVPIVSGTVVFAGGSSVPTSVTAVLDPKKIRTGEDDRDGVLQTSDWFDTAKYPTWTFSSEKITPAGTGGDFTIDGLLMIHGVSEPEHLTVATAGTPERPVYHATGQIDRHAFGISVTRLDPAIGNPVDVTLDIALK